MESLSNTQYTRVSIHPPPGRANWALWALLTKTKTKNSGGLRLKGLIYTLHTYIQVHIYKFTVLGGAEPRARALLFSYCIMEGCFVRSAGCLRLFPPEVVPGYLAQTFSTFGTMQAVKRAREAAKNICSFSGSTLSGEAVDFSAFAGKVVLIVNVASH